jgi:hypothetical protein
LQRKIFLKNSLGLLSAAVLIDSCKKTGVGETTPTTTNGWQHWLMRGSAHRNRRAISLSGGEITNPLNRSDITGGQTGVSTYTQFYPCKYQSKMCDISRL